jgi:thiamine kinase-like enzyme
VDDLSDILRRLESSPDPLSGGITNRNFRATLGGADYVIRLPGKDTDLLGIDRQAERLATEAAARLGIAPAVAATLEDCLITNFIVCEPVQRQDLLDGVEAVARALRSFHDSPTRLPTSFSVPDLLEDYAAIVRGRGGTLPGAYSEAVFAAARVTAALPVAVPRPCHNDLLAGNIIRAVSDGSIMIVDWEYAGMGDPRFDLGNLSINNGFDEAGDERLLRAYHGEAPSDRSRAALKLMRVLSDAREAAWGVVQGTVSELDFDFEGYADEHFERVGETVVRPHFQEWLVAAGGEQSSQTA